MKGIKSELWPEAIYKTLKGAGVRELTGEMAAIAACGLATIALAAVRFQKRIG